MPIWKGRAEPLPLDAIEGAAKRIGCEVAALRAVDKVESAGSGFRPDGSLERRFEPHKAREAMQKFIGFDPANLAPWRASLAIARDEREAMFDKAATKDTEEACKASSWGRYQIMGEHAKSLSYSSAIDMVEKMADRELEHLEAFVRFNEVNGLDTHLRSRDWYSYARGYNGSGQPEVYAGRMRRAYERFLATDPLRREAAAIETAYRKQTGEKSPEVVRLGSRGAAVRKVQMALGLEVDGKFGHQTAIAVRTFQAENGLKVDGVVGANTWAALEELRQVKAPAQEDQVARRAEQVKVAAGAASAVLTAIAPVMDRLPDEAFTILMWGIAAGIAIATTAWAVRWARRAR